MGTEESSRLKEDGVYQVQERAWVREFHRQSVSKKAIARRVGMSRSKVATQ